MQTWVGRGLQETTGPEHLPIASPDTLNLKQPPSLMLPCGPPSRMSSELWRFELVLLVNLFPRDGGGKRHFADLDGLSIFRATH